MKNMFSVSVIVLGSALCMPGCSNGQFDLDVRDRFGSRFDTTQATQQPVAARPKPDSRGVISYPNYQVALSQRGDSLADVARRVNLPVQELADYNGIPLDVTLRSGEVIVLPRRVSEPLSTAGARIDTLAPPAPVSIEVLAQPAIVGGKTEVPQPQPAQATTNPEPKRHKVALGETAYSISRRYGVPLKALAEWNGLGSDFALREGQFLLIPVLLPNGTASDKPTSAPGQGSRTPTPPSAAQPLPDENARPNAVPEAPAQPDLSGDRTAVSDTARMVYPVAGSIVRPYAKGRNDGIDIQGTAGGSVRAADAGSIAAITQDTDAIPIIVMRHANNLLTVYAGVTDIAVNRGDKVTRGQVIAKLPKTANPVLHFEIREGFESVDPTPYLE